MTTDDYPYIRAWGRMMRSHTKYIEQQIEQARADDAPPNAAYQDRSGLWRTTDDITRLSVRDELGLDPLPAQAANGPRLLPLLATAIAHSDALKQQFGLHTVVQLSSRTGLKLIFSTGYTVELRLTVQQPDSAISDA